VLLPRLVALLPAAWQYPEIAAARVAAGGIDARTSRFVKTAWMQRAEFPVANGETGVIEVVYTQAPSAGDSGFLSEERSLLDSIAAMLRAYFERLQFETQRLELVRSEASRQQAQEANAAKDQFLATLSHELRSPLNAMVGWIHMLRTGQMNDEQMTRGFDVLERSVRLQSKLIEDLLDVSRIVAGKLRMEKRTVDLAIVAANAVDAARPAARDKGVRLRAAITPELPVSADPQRLQQVMANLLTNALKFTPANGSVYLELERVDDCARLVVRDSGVGIAPDLLPRIFDRFQQGDATTRTHAGLGLGLAIVKHLVEQHGGEIVAASAGAGQGSTFTATFPLLAGEALTATEPASRVDDRAARSARSARSALSGVRVLVVDDEADARATLRALLEQFGATPTVVATAHEALTIVRQNPPDILLSDLAMPDEDGFALIRQVRTSMDADHLPAAALTGHVEGNARSHAAAAGYQEFVTKPIDAAALGQALARLARRRGESPHAV
jgi:signal transduction histidine kinase/CheY-like chemotaxis protein